MKLLAFIFILLGTAMTIGNLVRYIMGEGIPVLASSSVGAMILTFGILTLTLADAMENE